MKFSSPQHEASARDGFTRFTPTVGKRKMTSVHLKQPRWALAFIYLFVVQPLSETTKITNASAQSHRLHVSAAEAFRDEDPGPTGLEESSISPSNRLVLGLVESPTNQTQHQSVTGTEETLHQSRHQARAGLHDWMNHGTPPPRKQKHRGAFAVFSQAGLHLSLKATVESVYFI